MALGKGGFCDIVDLMVRDNLIKAIKEELRYLGVKSPKFDLEHPQDFVRGDYSTNVAMVYAKKLGRDPIELAGDIVQKLKDKNLEYVEKITVAGFGFINFHLTASFFEKSLQNIIDDKNFGQVKTLKKHKIIIEYTDPNPFKVFHIGHLMSNSIGEALSRLLEWNGAEVKRAIYQGDVGMHVAKAVYGMKQKPGQVLKLRVLGNINSRVTFLGESYVSGAGVFENDKEAENNIKEINKKIYERTDKTINYLYDLGRRWSLDYFETIYKRLGTKFDFYFFESESGPFGKKIVENNLKSQVFEQSEGAIVYKGEAEGLHTRVFMNSEGLPTYEAKELGLAQLKADKYDYTDSIVVTANEQLDYFKVVLSVMEKILPGLASKTTHIVHGLLLLPTGKMSSRTGDVVAAETLLAQIEDKVMEKMTDRPLSKKEKKNIATKVAVGALKFSVLKQSPGKDIIFDFDKSLSFEGDSGPYLQYTAVRAKSVLDKAHELKISINTKKKDDNILVLERMLYQLPEVVERAGQDKSPQLLVTYLSDLAASFNSFYSSTKILDESNESASYYLGLTKATRRVLKNGLSILGILVPDKM